MLFTLSFPISPDWIKGVFIKISYLNLIVNNLYNVNLIHNMLILLIYNLIENILKYWRNEMKKFFTKKRLIILSVIAVILAVIIIGSLSNKSEPYAEEKAKKGDLVTYYTFEGNVSSEDSQDVVSKTNLSVKTFHVKKGDKVNAGDLLFELDDSSIISSLDQAKASVELAKINYDMAVGSSKEQQLAQAKLSLNTAKINYDSTEGVSKDQMIIQTTNALESAQSAFDSAKLNLERIQGLYQLGGAAMVEVEQAQASHDAAEMQLRVAQDNFDKLEANVNQSVSLSKEQLEAAERGYNALSEGLNHNIRIAQEQLNQAMATLDSIQQQADEAKVKAEVSGEVSDIHVVENQSLVMGMPIMDIVNFQDLEIVLKVDEHDLSSIAIGKEADVTISALGLNLKGTVTDISNQALVVNGVSYFDVSISLEKNENLRVGLSAEVSIINESSKDTTIISMKALQFDDENLPYVYYRDDKGKVATKQVKVGINDGIMVEILEGISADETILLPLTYMDPMMMTMGPVD